jgi:hypothetical protein
MNKKENSKNKIKYLVYLASVCCSASLVGLIGTYAVSKKYMA